MAFLKSKIVLFTLSLITIFAIFWSNWSQEIIVNEKAYIVSPLEAEEIKLFAVGDIMLDRGVEYMVRRYNGGDFIFPFLNIKKELDNSDILFGNLESVISDKGERVGSIYSFRADIDSVAGLKYAGFDIVSLANNHMFDYQSIALEDTMNNQTYDC